MPRVAVPLKVRGTVTDSPWARLRPSVRVSGLLSPSLILGGSSPVPNARVIEVGSLSFTTTVAKLWSPGA